MPKQNVILPEDLAKAEKEAKQDSLLKSKAELNKLTPKRRKLVEIIAKNPLISFTEAARQAGYKIGKNSRAATIKREIAGKLSVTLREMGIFESDLGRVAMDALNATKVQILRIPERNEKGKVTGERLEVIEVPDHNIRLAAFKQICMLGDYFPAKKIDLQKTEGSRPFKDLDLDLLQKRAQELQQAVDAEYTVVTESEQDDEEGTGAMVHPSGDSKDESVDVPEQVHLHD